MESKDWGLLVSLLGNLALVLESVRSWFECLSREEQIQAAVQVLAEQLYKK